MYLLSFHDYANDTEHHIVRAFYIWCKNLALNIGDCVGASMSSCTCFSVEMFFFITFSNHKVMFCTRA